MAKKQEPEMDQATKAVADQQAQAIESAEAAVKKAELHLKYAHEALRVARKENG